MELPKRKRSRLQEYDYSTPGAYFVTICTEGRKQILSNIVGQGLAPAECALSPLGEIAKQQLLDLENRYSSVKVDKYVIMPNHIHIIFVLSQQTAGASPCPTLSDVVCTYKSITTRICNKLFATQKIFQRSFYDHIIRNENDYREIWEYIDTNPAKWAEDKFYTAM